MIEADQEGVMEFMKEQQEEQKEILRRAGNEKLKLTCREAVLCYLGELKRLMDENQEHVKAIFICTK